MAELPEAIRSMFENELIQQKAVTKEVTEKLQLERDWQQNSQSLCERYLLTLQYAEERTAYLEAQLNEDA